MSERRDQGADQPEDDLITKRLRRELRSLREQVSELEVLLAEVDANDT